MMDKVLTFLADNYLIFMIVHFAFMKRVCKLENIKEDIYDNRFIALFTTILSIFCLVIQILYPYWWIRLLLLAILVLFIYIKRDIVKIFFSVRKER